MWSGFHPESSWFYLESVQRVGWQDKVLRTIAVYALLLVIFRITGKRGLAAMNTFDIVVMLLLANVVQNAVIGPDDTLSGAVIGAVTLVAVNAVTIRAAVRWPVVRHLLEGRPRKVITDGEIVQHSLLLAGIQKADLKHAVRLQSGNAIEDVAHGLLEPNGQLILKLKKHSQPITYGDLEDMRAQLARIESLMTEHIRRS